jgi:hypothetical protein
MAERVPTKEHDETTSELVARHLERYNLEDYLEMSLHPWALIWRNFLAGIARGFGIAVGATLLVALALLLLQTLGGLPIVGQFIHSVSNSLKSH